jgi:hypothetical protein
MLKIVANGKKNRDRVILAAGLSQRENMRKRKLMLKRLALTLACASTLALVVVIFDYQPLRDPGFESVQRYKRCPAGTRWHETNRLCLPAK